MHRHPDIYFTIPKNEHSSKEKQAARPENEKKMHPQYKWSEQISFTLLVTAMDKLVAPTSI